MAVDTFNKQTDNMPDVSDHSLEQMNVVIVGHVDHGKSSVIGRLMADTNSLPEGKLEQVKAYCAANSRPFEYAFLLDALKDEQAQGITIDSARCFFNTKKRHYIIIDAPGHIEFLKNMISGAARAEAALLVIDAKEGVQENSKRHGYMVSILGIKQVVVLVNKMDLVDYDEKVFESIKAEYNKFLQDLGVTPAGYIPVSALEGDNVANHSNAMPWYTGNNVLEQIDLFNNRQSQTELPFRLPVQDIYKFTDGGDDRRIVAGTIDTGSISVGDDVTFLPSGKTSKIKSIENFSAPATDTAKSLEHTGLTLTSQIYIRPGELLIKTDDPTPPQVSRRMKVNIFWMGKKPMQVGKNYKLKLASARAQVKVIEILSVLNSSTLGRDSQKEKIEKNEVAEVILETAIPVAYDLSIELENTGRLIIIDDYEIAGGGIILEGIEDDSTSGSYQEGASKIKWSYSATSIDNRSALNKHRPKFILVTGKSEDLSSEFAHTLEQALLRDNFQAYSLGIQQPNSDESAIERGDFREEQLDRLSEIAEVMTRAGNIFIGRLHNLDEPEINRIIQMQTLGETLVVHTGLSEYRDFKPHVIVEDAGWTTGGIKKVIELLKEEGVIKASSLK